MADDQFHRNELVVADSPRYVVGHLGSPSMGISTEGETLQSLWRVIRKRRYLIGLVTLATVGLAVLVCIFLPRQYTGTATMQLGKEDSSSLDLLHGAAAPPSPDEMKTDMSTHIAVLKGDSVALAVIKDLHLQDYRPFAFKPSWIGRIDGSDARIEAERGLPLGAAPATRERLLKKFASKLKVKQVPGTRLIEVSFTNYDPKLAGAVANDVVRQYVALESHTQTTGEASQWLAAQLSDLKNKMTDSQKKLAAYEKTTGLNTLLIGSLGQAGNAGGPTHIPALDKLDALNQELTAAEANRLSKEAIYHLTQTQNPEVVMGLGTSSLPGIAGSAVVAQGNGLELLQTLEQQQSTLKLNYADLSTKYGAKNPRLVEMQNEISNLDGQISDELQKINQRAKNDYLLARDNENGLRQAFARQQEEASQLNASTVHLEVLAQEAQSSRQLYDELYGKLQEANVQAGLRATNIGIADPARTSATPTRPNPPLYLAIGFGAGLLFGISSAFFREYTDETVHTVLQIGPPSRSPVLASLPFSRHSRKFLSHSYSLNGNSQKELSDLITRPRSPEAEAYRSLRTSILLSAGGADLHSLLIASPLSGEGKTTIAYNTAVAFAQAGLRVALVDGDMRDPGLHEFFDAPLSPGLSDALTAGTEPETKSHPIIANLSLVPAGSSSTMSAELLGSPAFDKLFADLKSKYDLVILDSPPLLFVTDGCILARKVDAAVLVARAGLTTRTVVERVTELLKRTGTHFSGFILNAVDTRSIDFFYAYGHDGGGKYHVEHSNV